MNENIGVKGGKRDRKRTLLISKNKKKKLEEYNNKTIEEKEKEVRRIQLETLIKVIPIVTLTIPYRLVKKAPNKDLKIEAETKSKEINNEEITKKQVEVKVLNQQNIMIKETTLNNIQNHITKNDIKEKTDTNKKNYDDKNKKINNDGKEKNQNNTSINPDKKIRSNDVPFIVPLVLNTKNNELEQTKETVKEKESIKKIDNIKNVRIIEHYENKLKQLKYELKQISFDYWSLEKKLDKTYTEKEAIEILEKLNILIKKLDELKKQIKVDNINKYDDNYIYQLIEEYINEFNDNKPIKEIKNSDLYILLSEKINNLDKDTKKLKTKVETKKEKLNVDNKKLENLKEKYANYENFNNKLIEFQDSQDKILKEIERKIANSSSIEERTKKTFKLVKDQSNKLLEILGAQALIPGLRSAKMMAATTVTYMTFFRKSFKLKIETRKYNVIQIKDYSNEIEKNIDKISDIENLLDKTSYSLDKMINDFKYQYKDYFSQIPDCDKLLNNLLKVKEQLNDKTYEINQIKKEQKINLEKNNQKVKKLDNKEVM